MGVEVDNYTTRLGNTKHVSEPDTEGYISKIFKTRRQMLPLNQQRILIAKKMQYFGEYIPETELVEFGKGEYYIKQKYIKGKTLAETNVSDLSAETLGKLIDFIKKYLKYYKEQGGELDLTGYQYYEGNPCKIKRMFLNFLRINKNFLTSTNIMISEDGNVYMVDICESADIRLKGKIKNFCAKPFIKKTISRLEKTFQSKIDLQKETTSSELSNVLN